ncbi:MAG TPA: glycosyltransferase [Candidatus Acidoferrales bacterium]|nr:glycosyltransferase [Candidatus Acidoferrales bacterium]
MRASIVAFLVTVQAQPAYGWALLFFAAYPVLSALVWVSTGIHFYLRRERGTEDAETPPALERYPMVSVLVPAFCEEKVIAETLTWATRIDYPNYEVVVVDDASTDRTRERVRPFIEAGTVRLIAKEKNEGKAMAMNDALPCLRGELILVMDADACPDPQILRWMVPHFESPRVAGVTGNPRVFNRVTFLSQLQVVEFTSIVSLLRRAQRIWGRILTMSGVVSAFRRSALIDVGRYSAEMATEDIDMTWKLQRAAYDIRYEPRALVWMFVPHSLAALVKQRRRWAIGLAQVLRRHAGLLVRWRTRRMWPVYYEAVLSILWAYDFVVLTALWIASYAVGVPPVGASPIPNWWGMTIGTLCLIQLLTGVLLDRRYDRTVLRHYPVAVSYPIIYWTLMALTTAFSTPAGLVRRARRGTVTQWRTVR